MTRFHSKLLQENGKITADESVIFDSGVTFSEKELRVIRREDSETIKAIHYVKEIFGGDLEYCEKMREVYSSPSKMYVEHTPVIEPAKVAVKPIERNDSEQLTFDMLMR